MVETELFLQLILGLLKWLKFIMFDKHSYVLIFAADMNLVNVPQQNNCQWKVV